MSATLHSLVLAHDTAGARRLRGASNPDAGIITAAVPPDMRRGYELSWELLTGLGKVRDVSGAGRHEDINWEVLAAWIAAHCVQHLVLVDAQWLGPKVLVEVIGFAALSGVDLWLVAQGEITDAYLDGLRNWPVVEGGAAELAGVIQAAAAVRPPTAAESEFPDVPADNYLTFRAEARRLLSPEAFSIVDDRYQASYLEAKQALVGLVGGWVTEKSVLVEIRRQFHGCASTPEMQTCARGIQAAAHRAGWLVSVALPRLICTADQASRAAVTAPSTWRRLRAYREPYRGAACALVACDLALETLQAVSLDDVSSDGTVVTVARRPGSATVEVPPGADLYLRAQVAYRRFQGATGSDPLFGDERCAMGLKYLANAVRSPILEVGVPLYSQSVDRAELDPDRWALRWGISVQEK